MAAEHDGHMISSIAATIRSVARQLYQPTGKAPQFDRRQIDPSYKIVSHLIHVATSTPWARDELSVTDAGSPLPDPIRRSVFRWS
jgi:hypothetical protein